MNELRDAAQAVVSQAEADDNFDGEFIDYLVPFDEIDRLRAALSGVPEGAASETMTRRFARALHGGGFCRQDDEADCHLAERLASLVGEYDPNRDEPHPVPSPEPLDAALDRFAAGPIVKRLDAYATDPDDPLHADIHGLLVAFRAALSGVPEGQASGSICKCGLAKPYHTGSVREELGVDHDYEPRYPVPSPEPLDVERLAKAMRVIDHRIAAVADEADVDSLIGPDAEVGRRDYAEQIAAAYLAAPQPVPTDET